MNITTTRKFANIAGMITAVSIFGLVACNSDDYNNNKGASDSSAVSNSSVPGADNTGKDTVATAATTPKATKRKGHASIIMPAASNDVTGKTVMVKDKEGVYSNVQVMPEFPGGQSALADYVNNHVEYPQQAIDDNTTGTVKISFVVDEKGKITDAHLINAGKVANGLEQEALRVVNTMPAWKPGQVKGKNVKTRLELPISFQFEA